MKCNSTLQTLLSMMKVKNTTWTLCDIKNFMKILLEGAMMIIKLIIHYDDNVDEGRICERILHKS